MNTGYDEEDWAWERQTWRERQTEVDHGVDSSLRLAEQAFQQIASVPQGDLHAQRGMTTYYGTGIK
jgi:hypothetical protein